MSSIISTKASSALNNLRLLMVFAIVCQHSRIDQDITNGNATSFIKYFCNFEFPHDFICHLFHPSVPILFILSGYLFFFNVDNYSVDEYKKKLLGRVKSILVPFLIWTAIGIVATPFLYKKDVTFLYIIESLTTNPIGVLWYLRDLIVIALMSPIYYYIVKKVKIGGGYFNIYYN